jgi:hypothetical protein
MYLTKISCILDSCAHNSSARDTQGHVGNNVHDTLTAARADARDWERGYPHYAAAVYNPAGILVNH